jgi:hypothetical protein
VRLGVQTLEARDVPAATTTLDLSFTGAQVTANSAILQQTAAVPSSNFHTFLALQNSGTEEGYNTDARPFQLNQVGNLTVTRSLRLADIPTVTINGTVYRQFFLDVNETTKNPQVTLEELRIYLAEAGNLTGYNSRNKTLSGIGAAWDLDGAGNVSVKLNAQLNAGTGTGDAFVLIPSAFFGSSTYVYLYSKFGGKIKSDNGAEFWGVLPPPPPPAGSLSGYVYFDADNDGVREPNGNQDLVNEVGLEGVAIHLQGTNDLGQTVDITVFTDANGYYAFSGLRAGTYSITKEFDPAGFYDGMNTIGSAGGSSNESNSEPQINGPDQFYNIVLGAGVAGSEYNFGELEQSGGFS